jgi:NAD(P)H dehydrogenase (quinone)
MAIVSIVYQSGAGHTRVLADAIAKGSQAVPNTQVHILEIRGEDVIEGRWNNPEMMQIMEGSDAIVFGATTYMGSVSAIYKAFLEKAFDAWKDQLWKDKIAAGFTNSASQNGDKLSTLIQLPGNNWSGGTINDVNRLGSWLGAMGQSNGDQDATLTPSQGDRLTAERLGQRVASITHQWLGTGVHVTERMKAF